MKLNNIIYLLVFGLLFLFSCQDPLADDDPKVLNIFLIDCPFEAEEVNVEILNILVEDEEGTIVALNTAAGIYNLLEFQGGVDTLIASGNVDFNAVENLYFELGENNTIVVEGETYALGFKKDNEVKVKMDYDLLSGDHDLVIDFFACTSIIRKDGEYLLKPVLKFKGPKGGGGDDHVEDLIEDLEECYSLVFPISVIDEASNTISVNDKEELIDVLLEGDIVDVVYPFSVVNTSGENIVVNSKEDVKALEEDCEEDDEDEDEDEDDEDEDDEENEEMLEDLEEVLECYEVSFPVNFIDEDSMMVSVSTMEELEDIIEEESLVLVFPIELIDDQNSFSVNTAEELHSLAEECDEDDEDEEDEFEELIDDISDCYDIVFPFSIVDMDGTMYSITSEDELEDIIEDEKNLMLVYPFQLEDDEDVILDVTNEAQLLELLEDC